MKPTSIQPTSCELRVSRLQSHAEIKGECCRELHCFMCHSLQHLRFVYCGRKKREKRTYDGNGPYTCDIKALYIDFFSKMSKGWKKGGSKVQSWALILLKSTKTMSTLPPTPSLYKISVAQSQMHNVVQTQKNFQYC